ncbi:MAG: family 10 glycosylhydrolase, partial [Bacillota bacterium]|nr:family 10 glycosylhydrolase [Bacillota bacterium]
IHTEEKTMTISSRVPRTVIAVFTAFLLLAALLCPAQARGAEGEEEFRAVWVATVFGLNYPSQPTTDPAQLRADALEILDNAAEMGFNAVIFQVRPASDAFYESDIYPWSAYLTGTQGLAPEDGFDPLAFFTEEAHKRGLELHAWINPYRVTALETENNSLSARNPALLSPELTVLHSDGKLYWNPGEPAARQLIIDGVKEIVDNYDVDGIHIDDYFYPGTEFADQDAFARYGGAFSDIGDWRRSNNDLLVQALYETVHAGGGDVVFGVSPQGIWANRESNSLGSATNGSQAYYGKYADTRGWVKKGWLDYIAPQIYWNFGYAIADYEVLADWWMDVVQGTGVKLYIGMAAYRACNTDSSSPWYGTDEIRRQLEWNRQHSAISGYAMYSYAIFAEQPAMYRLMQELNGDPSLFTDMSAEHWAYENVAALVELGAVAGYPDGSFRPENNITRAEFLKIAMEAAGETAEEEGAYWYSGYYAKALEDGVLLEEDFTEAQLALPIDRGEMAMILVRTDRLYLENPAAEAEEAAASITDFQSIEPYYQEYVAEAYAKGFLTGYPDGSFGSGRNGSRAEASTMVLRLLSQ